MERCYPLRNLFPHLQSASFKFAVLEGEPATDKSSLQQKIVRSNNWQIMENITILCSIPSSYRRPAVVDKVNQNTTLIKALHTLKYGLAFILNGTYHKVFNNFKLF